MSRLTRWVLSGLFLASAAASYAVSNLKYHALAFHTRDYDFYLQFASRALDHRALQSYSLNPEGFNFLHAHGTEGMTGLHQTIHFEPVKYLYALLYSLAGDPRILFALASLVCSLPVLYMAFASPKAQTRVVSIAAFAYALFLAPLYLPSLDMRPFLFIPPLFCMALLSITFSRPLWEVLCCFNAMFLAREEALILGALVIGYAMLRGFDRKQVLWLAACWLAWLILTLWFFRWSGYQEFWSIKRALAASAEALALLVALALIWWRAVVAKRPISGGVGIGAIMAVVTSCALATLVASHYTPQPLNRTHSRETASGVWKLRKDIDRYRTNVLTDYATHQAFYDCSYAYTYERLPWALVPGKERYFPANLPRLRDLVRDEVEYIVVSRPSVDVVRNLMAQAGVTESTIFANEGYVGLKVIRP